MADNPDNPDQSTPAKVTVHDIGIAPFIFFEVASNIGFTNGIVNVTLAASRHPPTLCPWLILDVISPQPSDFAMRLMVPSCLEASSKVVRTEHPIQHPRSSLVHEGREMFDRRVKKACGGNIICLLRGGPIRAVAEGHLCT